MLTRDQFTSACKAFAAKQGDWHWKEQYPYGYLSRTQHFSLPVPEISDDQDAELDPATAPGPPSEDLISQQYIVFSPGFQVPAFYFTAHSASVLYVFVFAKVANAVIVRW